LALVFSEKGDGVEVMLTRWARLVSISTLGLKSGNQSIPGRIIIADA